jgi:serine/threonine protein kinase
MWSAAGAAAGAAAVRGALALLRRLLAFDPADRPSAEEALADPYFHNLHSPAREPSAQVGLTLCVCDPVCV